jgi:hypothetical protein
VPDHMAASPSPPRQSPMDNAGQLSNALGGKGERETGRVCVAATNYFVVHRIRDVSRPSKMFNFYVVLVQ